MKKNKLEKILIVSDTHRPYHNKKAWALMLRAAKEFKPDTVVIMGDYADFFDVSSHSKSPERRFQLAEEIADVKVGLQELKDLGASRQIFIEGNHENRLVRYLADKAPELFKLINIPDILELKKFDFEYVPYKEYTTIGKMNFTHDLGQAGRTAHLKALDSFQDNIIIGHVHRMHYSVEGDAKGVKHLGASFGWLGDENEVDYMHKAKIKREWCLGFGIAYHNKTTGNVYAVPVPIIENTCLIEGKLIK